MVTLKHGGVSGGGVLEKVAPGFGWRLNISAPLVNVALAHYQGILCLRILNQGNCWCRRPVCSHMGIYVYFVNTSTCGAIAAAAAASGPPW